MKALLLTLLGLAIGAGSFAQFRLSAEFRPRTEYSHGYATLPAEDQKASLFTSQRTRLNFEYKAAGIQTRLVLQDVRLWGGQSQQVTNENYAVSVHEAWAEAFLTKSLSIRLGRQELQYDNGRLFGNAAWVQQARSHDLALLRFSGFIDAHLGVAYHESGNRRNNLYLGPDAYKFLQFIWLNKTFGPLKVSLYGVNNGVPQNTTNSSGDVVSQRIRYTQTFGPWFEYTAGKLVFNGNVFSQTGQLANGREVAAYEYMVEATWKPVPDFLLGAGFEELSGTDYPETATTTTHSFSPLYPTGHKFNGHMDYFYAGNHGGTVGLRDLYVKTGYTLKSLSLGLDIHHFLAAANLTGNPDRTLGTELDFYSSLRLSESVDLGIGYSHLLPTETLQQIKGGSADATANWAWVMFTFKPAFIR